MTTPGILIEKQDSGVEEWISEPIRKSLSEVDEEVKALEEAAGTGASDGVNSSLMPEFKGLEILRTGVYPVDLDKTLTDMFTTIKNMEAQLEKVIKINSHLEEDLKASRGLISILKSDKAHLEQTLTRMEQEIPSKRELQIEIDHLIEERNAAQSNIQEMKRKLGSAQKAMVQLQNRLAGQLEEKKDAITEINFLESRLNAATEKMKRYEAEINILKGEKLVQVEKVRAMEAELNEVLTEKYSLLRELKETKEALDEIRASLGETRRQAKMSFYKGPEETSHGD